ncbi:hypothetical protein [Spirosoma flavum]|uniref:Adenylyltransferase SoFic-like C-terminal domain-containing protein n=1 Tax=Spirosoma flavum TaxID=2048557 RepID=A0ABW6AQ53_9BACT
MQVICLIVCRAIRQITLTQLLVDQTIEKICSQAPKVCSNELVEVLFEYPYSNIDYLVNRLQTDRRTGSN